MQVDGWDVCRCYCGITGQAVTDGWRRTEDCLYYSEEFSRCIIEHKLSALLARSTSLVVYIDFCYNMQVRNC